jgi:hypothetical protein
VHTATAQAKLGDRISVQGSRLPDGTIRAVRLHVVSHTRRAMIRGVVVRQLPRSTLVATGRSVIAIHHAAGRRVASAGDDGGLPVGSVADFRVRIDDDDVLQEVATVPVGQTANVMIEGTIVTVSPLVVSLEGLPITITVPAGMTLPTTLAIGQRIELTVTPAAGNVFTLVSIDEENANPAAAGQEVEVKGSVVDSTTTQIMVNSGGTIFTFAAPVGTTLPILPNGTFVEARGVTVNGVLTLERLKVEDNHDNGGGGSGDGGGGDGGGHGGGGHGGGGH